MLVAQLIPIAKRSANRRGPAAFAALAVAAGLVLAVGAADSPGKGPPVSCGDTATTSVKLTTDLFCSSGDGLDVGATNVTIDLGGHTIYGNISSNGILDNGYPGLTVKNGVIVGSDVGVYLQSASNSTISGVIVRGGFDGLVVDGSSQGTALTKDTIVAAYHAVRLFGDGSSLTKSTVTAPQVDGVTVLGADVEVSGNRLSADQQGALFVTGQGDRIVNNVVQGSGFNSSFPAVDLYGAQNAIVSGNTVSGATGDGLLAENSADGATITGNTINGNAGDGIGVSANSDYSVITGNTAGGNAQSGIDVVSITAKLGKNTADVNGATGITAPVGATDLGGNKSANNGQSDCTIGGFPCK